MPDDSVGVVSCTKQPQSGKLDRMKMEQDDTPMSTISQPFAQAQRLALLQTRPAGQLLIHEIYRSIQGESTFAGLPCVFVRLAVCDARCVWCDTPHAFNEGRPIEIGTAIKQTLAFACPLVEVTGGEPL